MTQVRPLPAQCDLEEMCTPIHARARPAGMTTELWKSVPVMLVPVRGCLPTQRVNAIWVIEYLQDSNRMSFCGDFFGHIVVDEGRWLIEDGHHRWAAAVWEGATYWAARVLVLPVVASPSDRVVGGAGDPQDRADDQQDNPDDPQDADVGEEPDQREDQSENQHGASSVVDR
jgi:hypothetical protein